MNAQQQLFVQAYLTEAKGNGTRAAILAGYSERTASVIASQLLRKPAIKAEVERHIKQVDLTTQARLRRLGKIADAEPKAISAADVISANALILKVNGALKDNSTDSRITVNIGFLQPATAPAHISVTTTTADAINAEVMPSQPHRLISGDA